MAENVIRISASGLPDIFPMGWTDKMYTYFRTVPDGLWEQSFVTDEKSSRTETFGSETGSVLTWNATASDSSLNTSSELWQFTVNGCDSLSCNVDCSNNKT